MTAAIESILRWLDQPVTITSIVFIFGVSCVALVIGTYALKKATITNGTSGSMNNALIVLPIVFGVAAVIFGVAFGIWAYIFGVKVLKGSTMYSCWISEWHGMFFRGV